MYVICTYHPTLESFKSKHGSSQVWSEHDYMSGPQENLRVLQSYEAEYAKRVAFAEEGFRDPKVLAGDLAMAIFFWWFRLDQVFFNSCIVPFTLIYCTNTHTVYIV